MSNLLLTRQRLFSLLLLCGLALAVVVVVFPKSPPRKLMNAMRKAGAIVVIAPDVAEAVPAPLPPPSSGGQFDNCYISVAAVMGVEKFLSLVGTYFQVGPVYAVRAGAGFNIAYKTSQGWVTSAVETAPPFKPNTRASTMLRNAPHISGTDVRITATQGEALEQIGWKKDMPLCE